MTQDKPLSQPMRVEGPAAPVEPRKRKSPWSAIAATGSLLLVKLKAVLGLLKLATLGKFAITAVSMLAMVWVEAQRSGWLFGVGFVFLILIHELGHGWAIQRAGLNAGWPVFVPFFGAMIALKGRPRPTPPRRTPPNAHEPPQAHPPPSPSSPSRASHVENQTQEGFAKPATNPTKKLTKPY